MQEKGVLFSVMVLFMLLSLLSLHSISAASERSLESLDTSMIAYKKVYDKLANIQNNVSVISKNPAKRDVDARILPFGYTIDGNLIKISADFPTKEEKISAYLEALNIFKVFAEDTNYSNEYDSLKVDINVSKPPSWGGQQKSASFDEEPHCLKYSLDGNDLKMAFYCTGFDFSSMARLDLNITLKSTHDMNSLDCNFNGVASCPAQDYNAHSSRPYVKIIIDDSECSACGLGQKVVSAHFNPGQKNYAIIKCVGASCKAGRIDLNFSGSANFRNTAKPAEISTSADMNSAIESFYFSDANILVSNEIFGEKKWG